MILKQSLIGLLIIISVVLLGLQYEEMDVYAAAAKSILCLLLIVLYFVRVKDRSSWFLAFLIFFMVGEIMNFIGWLNLPRDISKTDYMYYIVNSLYIVSYILLIGHIFNSLNFREIIRKQPFPLLVLIILDVFSVIVVTNIAISRLTPAAYYLELLYNIIIMTLLSIAVVNYIHKSDKKAITILVGAVFIFFSEVLQIAYFYITKITLLNVICSLFLIFGFTLFYLQSRLSYEEENQDIHRDLAA